MRHALRDSGRLSTLLYRSVPEELRVYGLADPAVFCTTVQEPEILFYSNDRQEEEFIVNLPPGYPLSGCFSLSLA